MEEQLISFEVAKLAKDKGFTMLKDSFKSALVDSRNHDVQRYSFYRVIRDEMSLNLNVGTNSSHINGLWESYNDDSFVVQKNYFAPTQSLLQKWLRDTHELHVSSWCNGSGWAWEVEKTNGTHICIMDIDGNVEGVEPDLGMFTTYEMALENGLQKALKMIKTN